MTKRVWIKVAGYHTVDGVDQEPVITDTQGTYAMQGGKHYIRYDEQERTVHSLAKFREGFLEVTKKGSFSSNMRFEAGKMNVTTAETPAGIIEIGIDTESVTVIDVPNKITVIAVYALYAGGQKVQDSRVEITVIPYPII